ncbi:hypothetical protein [uncultured Bacteroides sp.]|uniref:hypothetical protein n=1 Tax=uncultured Bacteroides sp. TaxID=162156 RepID=UPI0025EE0DE3|nr:hypothetical protein [uncultured Bacteroides sp.]
MYKLKNTLFAASVLLSAITTDVAAQQSRWNMLTDGAIEWKADTQTPHNDHIEMSGKQVSVVLRYGIDSNGAFTLNKSMVWPMLRTIPNNTHASLMRRYDWNPLDAITVNGRAFTDEKVDNIRLKGTLSVESTYDWGWYGKCKLLRQYFPSTELPALVENYALVNTGEKALSVEIPLIKNQTLTDPKFGVDGSYRIESAIDRNGCFYIQPGDTLRFTATIIGYKQGQPEQKIDGQKELQQRTALVNRWMNNLVLETPDPIIDRMFAFSKIRACESIYETQQGPMHGPGGESYYAAIWANDQAEYINPYFPFTGYEYGNASALNSFLHFARFMNEDEKPIPSSIVAEGLDIWNGVGDRGDAAMIAYGASRYALARGSREEARQLWPLITWCLEYCHRKLNAEGVVTSDTDELENRFPSGEANLCTSSLYYDALNSAACLAKELGEKPIVSSTYRKQAGELRRAIEKYFGSTVEGFDTYAYYKGNDILRSWICIPLTVGIDERADATIDALFSPRLWTDNGLLTQAGSETFWDRSTLYALRGVYAVGETKKATDFLHRYSSTRLLGEHVPYAIEAWPEGGQRHLSAESGLYGRIITEGLFGIRPTGFKSFSITPQLPEEWNEMKLKNIHAFGSDFAVEVVRISPQSMKVCITSHGKRQTKTLKAGETAHVTLK